MSPSTARPPSSSPWRGEVRACLALALPLMATNAIEMAMNLTNTVLIGHVGPDALAASTLAQALYTTALLFGIGLSAAVSPVIARGGGDPDLVRRAVQGGFWNAAIAAVPIEAVLWEAEPIFGLLGQDRALARTAADYLHVLQWSFLPTMAYLVLRSMLAAVERPGWAVVTGSVAVLVNAGLGAVLIGGAGPIPALGLAGSGAATVAANSLMAAALLLVVALDGRLKRYRVLSGPFRPDGATLSALWRLGLPIGVAVVLETGMFAAAAGLIGHYDEPALAAHAIALQVASFAFMVPLGIAQAATVRVGRAAGAGDAAAVGRAGSAALSLGVGLMSVSSLALIAAPRPLVGLFLDPAAPGAAAVTASAATLLALAGLFQVADGAQVVLAGMLRGLGDTRAAMLIAAAGYWGFGVPLAAALAPRSGAPGVWIGLVAGLFATAAMLFARWRAWRRAPGAIGAPRGEAA